MNGVLFASGAGSFTLGSTGAFTLTLGASGLSDQSTAAQNVSLALTLGAAASFTVTTGGALTISGGVNTNGFALTLTSSSTGAGTLSGVVSGTGSVISNGTGLWNLTGPNTYTGGTTLTAGTLVLGNATALGGAASTLTITGGTLDSSVANLVLTNNNPQAWNGNFTFAGSNALSMGTGAVTLNAGRTVTVSASTLTEGGIISGAFALTKQGAGTLALNGVNTYTGGTGLAAGTLLLGNAKALGGAAGTLTITGGTALDSSVAALVLTNNNPQAWNGDFTFVGSNALSMGTGAVTLGAARTVTVSASPLTEGGIISGAFALTK